MTPDPRSGLSPVDGRIPNLDVLRILVALEVMATHLAQTLHGPTAWAVIAPVPAFVCLSGYVIPASFARSRNWGHFAWKRFLRIVPPLVLSFVLVAAIGGVVSLWPTFLYYVTAGTIPEVGMNLPLWSLLVEEVLYAYHGASRILLHRWTIGMPIAALVACEVARHIGTPIVHRRQWQAACCFFAGNILYFHRDRIHRLDARWLLLLLPYLARSAYASVWRPLDSFLDVPAMVGVLLLAHKLPQIRFRAPDLSYGVYVYHWPLIALFDRSGLVGLPLVAASVSSTLALAFSSWHLVERHALRLKDVRLSQMWPRRRARAEDSP